MNIKDLEYFKLASNSFVYSILYRGTNPVVFPTWNLTRTRGCARYLFSKFYLGIKLPIEYSLSRQYRDYFLFNYREIEKLLENSEYTASPRLLIAWNALVLQRFIKDIEIIEKNLSTYFVWFKGNCIDYYMLHCPMEWANNYKYELMRGVIDSYIV